MVKRSRVLETEVDADVPYAQTRLAKAAKTARVRVGALLLLGAGGALLEAAITRSGWWLLATGALALIAWGTWRGRLGGAVAAAFLAVLATLVPLYFLFQTADLGHRIALGFVAVWGVVQLPLILTLLRDFELQYAYGLWARRE